MRNTNPPFPLEKEHLISYYQALRDSINDLNRIIVTILIQGTFFLFVALSISTGFSEELGASATFGITVALTLIASGISVAVFVYSGLLKKAVEVGKAVEDELLSDIDTKFKLTHHLETHWLAGGRAGRWGFRGYVLIIPAVTGSICGFFGYQWVAS